MCGISVVFSKDQNINVLQSIKFHDAINHRGPNFSKIIIKKNEKITDLNELELFNDLTTNIFFAHKRLKIIDKSNDANQPMHDKSSRYYISFNGEIYNYLELKENLISKKVKFSTKSDTEVLLKGFMKYGYDFLNQINGMFAFAIYDSYEHKLFLGRDRFGVKPLYYHVEDSKIYVFSEIKQILKIKKLKINEDSLRIFLKYNMKDYDNQTLLNDVLQIKPGHFITIDGRNFIPTQKCWYDAYYSAFVKNIFITNDFKKLLNDSIELRLRSDVEVGSQLSGGIDSSVVTSLAIKKDKNLHIFSAIPHLYEDKDREHIENFEEYFEINSHKYYYDDIGNEILNDDYFYKMQDEPILSFSYYLEFKLFNFISKNYPEVKVILNGHGPDELFGYKSDLARYNISKFNLKKIIQWDHLKFFFYIVFNKLRFFFSNKNIALKKIFAHKAQLNFKRYLFDQFTKYNLPMQLLQTDKSSMANSIEVRSPFLDYRLFEKSMKINEELFSNNLEKIYLRKSFKEELPFKILNRKDKIGFDIANDLSKKIAVNIYQILKKNAIFVDILKKKGLYNEFEKNFKKKNNKFLFKWYSLHRWLDENQNIII